MPMPLEIIISIAAAIILLLLATWIFNIFKLTFKTVLIVVGILLLLQISLGVNSQEVIQEIINIVQRIQQLVLSN